MDEQLLCMQQVVNSSFTDSTIVLLNMGVCLAIDFIGSDKDDASSL